MLSPPEAFMAVANATAAIIEKAPPYITYRVHGVVHMANGDADIDRTVSVRTEDGDAVIHDEKTGKDVLKPPFPAPPTFDALSEFQLAGTFTLSLGGSGGSKRDVDLRVVNIVPLHYTPVATKADAIAVSVRGYAITYAADSTPGLTHLHCEPGAQKLKGKHWLRDVWYDSATMIPSRIVYGGQNDLMLDTRYTTVDGVWLLQSIAVSAVLHAPLWIGRTTLAFHGDYADYRFATSAPDERLVPKPVPSPS
ncbi:MAG TPA: hypothetical protein VFE70_00295 [Candidatus Elarobacter sp.]|jgi:hypothetical protein|nr:hypothetical protein [Candidatus Elarobacter sp.]